MKRAPRYGMAERCSCGARVILSTYRGKPTKLDMDPVPEARFAFVAGTLCTKLRPATAEERTQSLPMVGRANDSYRWLYREHVC